MNHKEILNKQIIDYTPYKSLQDNTYNLKVELHSDKTVKNIDNKLYIKTYGSNRIDDLHECDIRLLYKILGDVLKDIENLNKGIPLE